VRAIASRRRKRSTAPFYLLFVATCGIAACTPSGTTKRGKRGKTEEHALPIIATPRAQAAFITNNGSDSLSAIDRDGTRVTTVAVDVDPDAREAPHHLAIDSRVGSLFVALAFPPPVVPSKDPHASHGNAETLGKLARVDLGTLAVTDLRGVDANPGDVILTHDRTRVLVTHFDMMRAMNAAAAGSPPASFFATLQVWNAKTLQKEGSRPLCVAPHGVITTADDKTAIVACYGSDELAIVDLTSPTLSSARFPLGAAQGVLGAPRYGPYSALLSPNEDEVVIADLEGADMRVFDLKSKHFLPDRTMTLGARVFMPEFVAATVIVAPLQSPDGLARIDIVKGEIEKRIAFTKEECQAPHVVRKTKDGRVYLVCEGDHTLPGAVAEIDPVTLAIKKRWVVGVYPDGIAFGED
jgi:DNA-binding beta-propeller fold protein YncE